jgi:flagellar biosynthesis GTPase FlhF
LVRPLFAAVPPSVLERTAQSVFLAQPVPGALANANSTTTTTTNTSTNTTTSTAVEPDAGKPARKNRPARAKDVVTPPGAAAAGVSGSDVEHDGKRVAGDDGDDDEDDDEDDDDNAVAAANRVRHALYCAVESFCGAHTERVGFEMFRCQLCGFRFKNAVAFVSRTVAESHIRGAHADLMFRAILAMTRNDYELNFACGIVSKLSFSELAYPERVLPRGVCDRSALPSFLERAPTPPLPDASLGPMPTLSAMIMPSAYVQDDDPNAQLFSSERGGKLRSVHECVVELEQMLFGVTYRIAERESAAARDADRNESTMAKLARQSINELARRRANEEARLKALVDQERNKALEEQRNKVRDEERRKREQRQRQEEERLKAREEERARKEQERLERERDAAEKRAAKARADALTHLACLQIRDAIQRNAVRALVDESARVAREVTRAEMKREARAQEAITTLAKRLQSRYVDATVVELLGDAVGEVWRDFQQELIKQRVLAQQELLLKAQRDAAALMSKTPLFKQPPLLDQPPLRAPAAASLPPGLFGTPNPLLPVGLSPALSAPAVSVPPVPIAPGLPVGGLVSLLSSFGAPAAVAAAGTATVVHPFGVPPPFSPPPTLPPGIVAPLPPIVVPLAAPVVAAPPIETPPPPPPPGISELPSSFGFDEPHTVLVYNLPKNRTTRPDLVHFLSGCTVAVNERFESKIRFVHNDVGGVCALVQLGGPADVKRAKERSGTALDGRPVYVAQTWRYSPTAPSGIATIADRSRVYGPGESAFGPDSSAFNIGLDTASLFRTASSDSAVLAPADGGGGGGGGDDDDDDESAFVGDGSESWLTDLLGAGAADGNRKGDDDADSDGRRRLFARGGSSSQANESQSPLMSSLVDSAEEMFKDRPASSSGDLTSSLPSFLQLSPRAVTASASDDALFLPTQAQALAESETGERFMRFFE